MALRSCICNVIGDCNSFVSFYFLTKVLYVSKNMHNAHLDIIKINFWVGCVRWNNKLAMSGKCFPFRRTTESTKAVISVEVCEKSKFYEPVLVSNVIMLCILYFDWKGIMPIFLIDAEGGLLHFRDLSADILSSI